MLSKSFCRIILAGLVGQLILASPIWSLDKGLQVKLKLEGNDSYYQHGERLPVTVRVKNISGAFVPVAQGFMTRKFYYDIRMIDPAGRLLQPKRVSVPSKSRHAPPLAFVRHQGKTVRVAPCETFPRGEVLTSKFDDLNLAFDMQLPGIYSAQVQVSTMVFRKQICTVDSPKWLGVLSSKVKYFYHEGKTSITVTPSRWRLAWSSGGFTEPVRIRIKYPAGKKMADYNLQSIRLENLRTNKYTDSPEGITFHFAPAGCIKILRQPLEGSYYPVRITGRFRDGRPFGGARKIMVSQ